jgi:hypothetical protein
MERKHVLFYRNGKRAGEPSAENMVKGELALNFTGGFEKIYLKNSDDKIISVSSDHLIQDVIDKQDKSVSDAIGLTIDSTSSDDVTYVYTPKNEILTECKTVDDSIEELAKRLKESLNLLNELKSNVYMLVTNLIVEYDRDANTQTISFDLKNGDSSTVASEVVIYKYFGDDDEPQNLYDETLVSSGSVTTSISHNKEIYSITVTPNLAGALPIKSETTRYLCYVCSSERSEFSSSDWVKLCTSNAKRYMSDGTNFTADIETADNEYIYVVVPISIRVLYITSEGITVPMIKLNGTYADNTGDFFVYRNSTPLVENAWSLKIYHVM